MITVKRTWKQSQVSSHTDFLDIWDSGSHLYERWPDGTENYWKIIERKEVEGGFEELMEKMPEWESPSQVLHRRRVPLTHLQPSPQSQKQNEFLVGGWQVTQEPSPPLTQIAHMGDRRKEIQEPRQHSGHRTSQRPRNAGGKRGPSFQKNSLLQAQSQPQRKAQSKVQRDHLPREGKAQE